MSISKFDNPALILIDFQKAFDNIEYWGGERNNLSAESNASELLKIWRETVFLFSHSALHGASATTAMVHIAITNYKDDTNASWLQPVTNEEYNSTN